MTQYLKQSTSVIVHVGPFVAVGDGFTPVANVVLTSADEHAVLKHNTSAAATNISGRTWSAVVSADGFYSLTLTSGDVDTVGPLKVVVGDDSLVLPVVEKYHVLEEVIYDALFGADAAAFDANDRVAVAGFAASAITQAAISANAIASAAISANAVTKIQAGLATPTNITSGTITTVTSLTTLAPSAIAATTFSANALTSAAISADAVTKIQAGLATPTNITSGVITTVTSLTTLAPSAIAAATFSANAITSAAISADAVSKITAAVATSAQIGVSGAALTDLGGMSTGMKAQVQTEADDALVAQGLDHLVASSVADEVADNSIIAKLAASDGDWSGFAISNDFLEAISARLPDGLTGGRIKADVGSISGSGTAADNLEASVATPGVITGAVNTTVTPAIGTCSSNLSGYTDDQLIGRVVIFTSGAAAGEATEITDYANTNGVLTYNNLTLAPGDADTFVIV